QELGRRLAHAVVQIFESLDAVEPRLQPPGVGFQRVQPFPEQFDLDRLRVAGQVVDHVRQNLYELDTHPRDRGGDFLAHVVDDRKDVARPTTGWLQARDDVARVLRRREQPQLGAGAAGRRFDFWRRRGDSLG